MTESESLEKSGSDHARMKIMTTYERTSKGIVEIGKYLAKRQSEESFQDLRRLCQKELGWTDAYIEALIDIGGSFADVDASILDRFEIVALFTLRSKKALGTARKEAVKLATEIKTASLDVKINHGSAKEIAKRHVVAQSLYKETIPLKKEEVGNFRSFTDSVSNVNKLMDDLCIELESILPHNMRHLEVEGVEFRFNKLVNDLEQLLKIAKEQMKTRTVDP